MAVQMLHGYAYREGEKTTMFAHGFALRMALAVAVVLASLSPAASLTVGIVQAAAAPDITQYRLDNGLEVILVRDESAPAVGVSVWYKVGSAQDPPQMNGFAHLFEHLMFQGSAHVPRGYFDKLIEGAGGSDNAWTSIDQTAYHEEVAPHQLPLALWLEADRMASLAIDQANFDREREVVKEEYRQSYANAPYGEASLKLETMPYDYVPYQRPTIGTVADLDRATLDAVRKFHDTYYKPNNAVLTVAGNIDIAETKDLIQRYFAGIPRRDDPPARPAYTFTVQKQPQELVLEDSLAKVPATLISYRIPPRGQPDYYAAVLLAQILGTGDSSRLARALIDTGLASAADAYTIGNLGPGVTNVILQPNPDVDMARVEKVYFDELDRIRKQGVSAIELATAVSEIRADRVRSLQRTADLAESVQEANFYLGDPQAVLAELDRYKGVTPADIQRVANEYLGDNSRNVIRVSIPKGSQPATGSEGGATGARSGHKMEQGVDLSTTRPITSPEPLPVKQFNLPEITQTRLDNGLQVVVVPRHGLPLVTAELVLPGGESAASSKLPGLAALTAEVLTRGTKSRSGPEIAQMMDQVGGALSASSDRDKLSISADVLTENTALAFDLLGDVALNPTFPADELANKRENMLSGLESDLADAPTVADKAIAAVLYGSHPYGQSATAESLKAITRQDIESFYQSQLDPKNALLVIAGDISPEDAGKQAQTAFGSWEAPGPAVAVSYPAPPSPGRQHINLVDRPGSSQAELRVGQLAIPGSSPERYALQVANQVLGGGYTSRLWRNLREKMGFAYSVYSGYSAPRDRGAFYAGAAVRNEVVEPALRAMLDEMERLGASAVPVDELNAQKSYLVGAFPLRLETSDDLMGTIISLKEHGLSWNDLGLYPTRIEGIDAAAVKQVAEEYIQPKDAAIVVVGDASKIRPDLEKIAPVTLIDAYGHPVK